MKPISPVAPVAKLREVTFAKDQPQYLPLPAILFPDGLAMSRWEFTDEERRLIAEGANLVFSQLTFKQPMQPIRLQVVAADADPDFMELYEPEPELEPRS